MRISCSADDIQNLTSQEVRKLIDGDNRGGYLLLDVRQPEEYEAGHIPGAVLIPLGELEIRLSELDCDRSIIVYCRSGKRSLAAAMILCGHGCNEILNLEGGILGWNYETLQGLFEERTELITDLSTVKDIFVLAIRLEIGSQDFYTQSIDRVKTDDSKEILQKLSDVEGEHIVKLYQKAANILGEKYIPEPDQIGLGILSAMEGAINISEALVRREELLTDELSILEYALEKEYMAYDFYKRTAILVSERGAKILLHDLAAEERLHADILLNRIAKIVQLNS